MVLTIDSPGNNGFVVGAGVGLGEGVVGAGAGVVGAEGVEGLEGVEEGE